ncbi:hypothetical protein ACN28S_10150 [Cystobacter fuscus]
MLKIKDAVCKVINDVLAEDGRKLEATADETKLSTLGLDSMSMARVIVTLDDECKVAPFTQGGVDVTSIRTLGDLYRAYSLSPTEAAKDSTPVEADVVLAADIVPSPSGPRVRRTSSSRAPRASWAATCSMNFSIRQTR